LYLSFNLIEHLKNSPQPNNNNVPAFQAPAPAPVLTPTYVQVDVQPAYNEPPPAVAKALSSSSEMETVEDFLKALKMEEHLAKFEEEGYDDLDIVKDLDDETLVDMGISKKGHRSKIMKAVTKLKAVRLSLV